MNGEKTGGAQQVRQCGGFWEAKRTLVREAVLPYQYRAISDEVEGAMPSYALRNFRTAAKVLAGRRRDAGAYPPVTEILPLEHWPEDPANPGDEFYGFVFQDTDVYKWIEASAYSLMTHPDSALEAQVDEVVALIGRAQADDGYLDTCGIIMAPQARFKDLRDKHELYCLGHMLEGALAYEQATGKDEFLKIACRYTDCVAAHIGPEEGKRRGCPGHEIAEMALTKLYERTGEQKYLDLCRYFLDERGTKPSCFDQEEAMHPVGSVSFAYGEEDADRGESHLPYAYWQAHRPVREQSEAVGHAVRAMYLYSGMADCARLTGDEAMLEACRRLFTSVAERKMYVTGGIGATHLGEAFSFDYDLPPDTAYAETCAAIGLVFFASRMAALDPDRRYGDVAERALYNNVLSGMSLDGTRFFYVNALEVWPKACREDDRKHHVRPVRRPWLGCACCPPNLARIVAGISRYILSGDDGCTHIHQYIGCTFELGRAFVDMAGSLPWDGDVTLDIHGALRHTFALRVPEWADAFEVCVANGGAQAVFSGAAGSGDVHCGAAGVTEAAADTEQATGDGAAAGAGVTASLAGGYLYLTGDWQDGARIHLTLGMPARFVAADERVRECTGQAALMRGPVVYCLEEADNGADLHEIVADPESEVREERTEIAGEPVVILKTRGWREHGADAEADGSASKAGQDAAADGAETEAVNRPSTLYRVYRKPQREEAELTWIPYYTFANRGEGEMRVFVRV